MLNSNLLNKASSQLMHNSQQIKIHLNKTTTLLFFISLILLNNINIFLFSHIKNYMKDILFENNKQDKYAHQKTLKITSLSEL